MNTLEKPKQKSVGFAPFTFLFGQPFDFISPLSLEECIKRLESKSERRKGWLLEDKRKLLVNVRPIDSNTSEFKFERSAGRNLNVEVAGELLRYEHGSTRVRGRARISRSYFLIIGIVLAVQLVFFLPMFSMRQPIVWLLPLAICISWLFAALERNKLERVVYNTLSDQIF